MYLLAANPITQSARLSLTARLHSRVKTVWESLHCPLIRRGLWPLHSPDFMRCDLYLWGSLKDNSCSHSGRTTKQHPPWGFNNFWARIPEIKHVPRRCTDCIQSGGQLFKLLPWHRWVFIRLSKGHYHS